MNPRNSNPNDYNQDTRQRVSSLKRAFLADRTTPTKEANVSIVDKIASLFQFGNRQQILFERDPPEHKEQNKSQSAGSYKTLIGKALVTGLTILVVAQLLLASTHSSASIETSGVATAPGQTSVEDFVSSLGRLEPSGQILKICPPSTMPGDRVAKLYVQEGQSLKSGQLIAELTSAERAAATCSEARARVDLAKAHLEQVKAGSHAGDIEAQIYRLAKTNNELANRLNEQKAIEKRLSAQLDFAEKEYNRYKSLGKVGAVSQSSVDAKYCELTTAQEQYEEVACEEKRLQQTLTSQKSEEASTLKRLKEVRPVDIAVAQAEVSSAVASLNHDKQEYDLCFIRAPKEGRVLRIIAHGGEAATEKGIVELGETDNMTVVADVYENDVTKVKLGAPATITSEAFPFLVKGTVSQIGWKVTKQHVFASDPRENMDNRVVEVRIKLNKVESEKVARFTDLQVRVNIGT